MLFLSVYPCLKNSGVSHSDGVAPCDKLILQPPLRREETVTNEHQQHAVPVRVLVVDDQRLMRDGLASLLSIQDGVEVVATAANGQEALERAMALQPDVILMDVRMPIMDGVAATAQVRRRLPDCQVLMLTTFDDEEYIIDALRAGATGYLLKDIPARDLAQAVQAAHKGIYQLDPTVASKVVSSLADPNHFFRADGWGNDFATALGRLVGCL